MLPAAGASAAACSSYPNWTAGKSYVTGDIVRYTDGKAYIAEHDNPGYDPTISTWYWDPYSCDGGSTDPSGSSFAAVSVSNTRAVQSVSIPVTSTSRWGSTAATAA